MNNFYKDGRELAFFKPLLRLFRSKNNRSRTLLSLVGTICFMLFNLSTAWAQFAETRAAEGQIKSLQIGDTIPEELWNLSLQVINHPDGKDAVTLNDYRDKKLIILDFWATWCAPCIRDLPDLLLFEETLSCKVLPLSSESVEKIETFLRPRKHFSKNQFYIYKSKGLLDKSFPRTGIPHTIVISNGIVQAITIPELLNRENLLALSNGETYRISNKIGLDSLRNGMAGLLFTDSHLKIDGYRIMLDKIDGLVPTMRWRHSDEIPHVRFQIANNSLFSVFATVTQKGGVFLRNPNRIKVQEASKYRSLSHEELSFLKNTIICYEGKYPLETSYITVLSKLKDDLEFYKGIGVEIEELPTEVEWYTLERKHDNRSNRGHKYTMKQVLFRLNQELHTAPLMVARNDEEKEVWLSQHPGAMTTEMIKKELAMQGWQKRSMLYCLENLVITGIEFLMEKGGAI